MKAKTLEVRDVGTFVAVLCVDMNPDSNEQRYLLRRCGYPCNGAPNIAMTALGADGGPCTNDFWWWGDRTRTTAHRYITEHWNDLRDGDVVDVQFILGETTAPKASERESMYVDHHRREG